MSLNNNGEWKVDFVGIAAPRCGTTWIAKCLEEHPEISFSDPKETFFFLGNAKSNNPNRDYVSFFSDLEKKCGEFSPFYFSDKSVAKKIYDHNPNAKLIAVLRDPVSRIRSAYDYRKQKGREPGRSLEQAVLREPDYINFGKYYVLLKPYIEFFGNNLLILILEEAKDDPKKAIREVYEHIGVNKDFVPPSLYEFINSTRDAHTYFPWFHSLVDYRKVIKKNRLGGFFIKICKKIGLNLLISKLMTYNMRSNKRYEPNMEADVEGSLRKEFFESNDMLFQYLGRRIKNWEK